MRNGVLFLVIGASLAGLGAVAGGLAWALLWPAMSFLLVGVAYLTRRPGMLGKRVNGTFPWWVILGLGPFLLLSWSTWCGLRALRNEEPSNAVLPGLWVGRRPLAHELPHGARLVVDLTAELAASAEVRCRPGYLCVPMLDGTAPERRTLESLLERLRGEDGILVHCAAGHGRSATVVAALLIERGHATGVAQAEARLRERRPGIRLSAAQRRCVEDATRCPRS